MSYGAYLSRRESLWSVPSLRRKLALLSRIATSDARTPLAWRIVAAHPTPSKMVAYLRHRVRYQADPRGDRVAHLARLLAEGIGDCDDVSTALVALLLRAGWPASSLRWVVGWRPPAQRSHLWVEAGGRSYDASTDIIAIGESPATVARFERVTTHEVTV